MIKNRNFSVFFIVSFFALISSAGMLLATKNGIGISTDSTLYIKAARNLIKYKALAEVTPDEKLIPITHIPPFLPVSLAALGYFGLDPLTGIRWLNSLLFGATTFLTGLFISPSVLGILLCSLLIIICSPTMLSIHSMAMAEPLFIFLNLLTIFLLTRYLENLKLRFLLAFSLIASFASLTKYTGLALIPCGVIAILLLSNQTKRKKMFCSIIYGVTGIFPILCWIIRNLLMGASFLGQKIIFIPIKLTEISSTFSIITAWFKPAKILIINLPIIIFSLLISTSTLKIYVKLKRDNSSFTSNKNRFIVNNHMPILMGIFIFSYLLSITIAKIFFDPNAYPCERYFSPLYIPVLIIIFYLINKLYRIFDGSILFKSILLAILFYISANYLFIAKTWITSSQGKGYTSKKWKQAAIIKEISELPLNATIASNKKDVIYILSNRVSWALPKKIQHHTDKLNAKYFKELDDIKKKLEKASAGFVVYFYLDNWQKENMPSEKELKEQLPLRLFWEGNEGIIYKIENKWTTN